MSIGTYFLREVYGLPRRLNRVQRQLGIGVPMSDGVLLVTDHFAPRGKASHPTILMRVPYGLRGFRTIAELYAERGFHVVLQACRGTGRSGGEFDPLSREREDGLATLRWVEAQPWFDGRIGLSGPSYLGYASWAICDALPQTSAITTKVTSAEFKSVVFPGGTFHLGLWLNWMQVVEGLRGGPFGVLRRILSGGLERRTLRASMKLPLVDADRRVVGRRVGFWRRWLSEAIGHDGFWERLDHTHRLNARTPPNHLISGWYDFMIDQLLRDYRTLVEAGHSPYLTIGPWFHLSPDLQTTSLRETLVWMRAHLIGDREQLRERPVRFFVSGRNEWIEADSFPPRPVDDQIWHLHPQRALSRRPVGTSPADAYRYDPRRPTPNLGGAIFAFRGAGPLDQKPIEGRTDVLTYTSDPLFTGLTILGNARMTLYARSSLPNTDFFVRLCDVDETGASINICDGILRKTSADPAVPDDIWKLTIRLHATAHCFLREHRIRVQVCSGAHPRYARNTGTDELIGEARRLVPADVEIFHDPLRPSALALPVVDL